MLIREKLTNFEFSSSERAIADFVLAHPERIEDMTVQEVARTAYTHPSTLIRVAKKMGYSGWLELKNAFLEEQHYLDDHFTEIDANFPFTSTDGVMTIAKKMAALETMTLEDSLSLLHHDQLQKARQYLLKADQIEIFASNVNTLIAQDFALQMRRIRKNVVISDILGESLYEAYNCPDNTCAILISYTGESQLILQALQTLKERKIPIIAITSIGENKLSKNCDCLLPITTREKLYSKIGSFSINTSICFVLDVLYAIVFSEHYQKNLNHLISISQRVDNRRTTSTIIKEGKPTDQLKITDSWIPN